MPNPQSLLNYHTAIRRFIELQFGAGHAGALEHAGANMPEQIIGHVLSSGVHRQVENHLFGLAGDEFAQRAVALV